MAETLIEVTKTPIDSSDATSVRIFIGILPKKTAVMAQPITPDETPTNGNFIKTERSSDTSFLQSSQNNSNSSLMLYTAE
ncbi:MAG: hypothetical protein AABY99_04850 [Pseudomonadota bacterium]